jgi:predicted metal-dependent peptidase
MNDLVVVEKSFYTARLRAVDEKVGFPYLYMSLHSLVPVFSEAVPTLATDRWWRCYVNPGFFATLSVDEGAAVLVHELWHPLGLDWERAELKGVTPETFDAWNVARDAELNTKGGLLERLPTFKLELAGHHFTCKPCTPATLGLPEGLFAEEMYDLLLERAEPAGDRPGELAAPGAGGCGSCVGGPAKPWDLPPPHEGGPDGHDRARTDLLRTATAQAIIEHNSRQIGTVPAGWLRWAKNTLEPKVRWLDEIGPAVRGFLTRLAGGSHPTRRKVGRRQPPDPRCLPPGRVQLRMRVSMVIDTSGSMGDDRLSQALAEANGICKALGNLVAVGVYFTDAAAAEAQWVTCAEFLRPIGGGGTDMGKGFEAIARDAERDPSCQPDLVVCVTDGYTPWPAANPTDARVIVVVLTSDGDAPAWAAPPDGKTIRCDDDA